MLLPLNVLESSGKPFSDPSRRLNEDCAPPTDDNDDDKIARDFLILADCYPLLVLSILSHYRPLVHSSDDMRPAMQSHNRQTIIIMFCEL